MPKPSQKSARKKQAVSVKELYVEFEPGQPVLDNVTFSISKGDIVAVIGPNGSGKTTLIKTILGLVKPKSGTVKLFGKHLHDVRDKIGYVPQRFHFDLTFPITIREFLQLAMHNQDEGNLITDAIKEVGLEPDILSKLLGTLSGGQLQRVLIAQAVINNPDLLILDEPSTGIDVVGEAAFYSVLQHLNKKHGTTVILISHDVSMVSSKVDQVICVNKKLLCSGPPKKTLTKSTLEKLFSDSSAYVHAHDKDHSH